MPITDPGLPKKTDKMAEQRKRKEKCKEEVVKKYNLEEDPPHGVQRVWTDGSQQKGKDGRPYAGYGVWFGERHPGNHLTMALLSDCQIAKTGSETRQV